MFGDVVRASRHRDGLSQEELAERSGLSVRCIRKIESNRTDRPRPVTVRLLADALGFTDAERERFWAAAVHDPLAQPRPAEPIPAQLHRDVPAFTGRETELGHLDRLQEPGTQALWVISGTAGVGKTALAVHWGHGARRHFPGGQLLVDLRGYDPQPPMTPSEALATLLSGLGVAESAIPTSDAERAARYRTVTAGRRMLIVLDNAHSVEQVRPLLPGAGPTAVLVTSRDSLAGLVALHGAQRLALDLLPGADARELLRRLLGSRVDTEREAARELVRQSAGLPLALRLIAERAAAHADSPLSLISRELTGRRRLAVLDPGGDPRAALSTVFSWSFRHLPPAGARAFAALGSHPGPDFDAATAAALTGTRLGDARQALELLTRVHLVWRAGRDRYTMHDLLRAYAASLAPPPTRQASTDRRRAAQHRFPGLVDAATGRNRGPLHAAPALHAVA